MTSRERRAFLNREVLTGICNLIEGQAAEGWTDQLSDGTVPTDREYALLCHFARKEVERLEKRLRR